MRTNRIGSQLDGVFGGTVAQRTAELTAVRTAAARAREGVTTVVTIEGEPGIGKTWLLRAAERELSGFERVERAGATSTPSLLIIDDAQWLSDADVASHLRALEATSRSPLLALVAGRTGESRLIEALKPASARPDRGAVIELRGLSTQQTIELAAEHGISALEATRADRLAELTDGNPLHLQTAFAIVGQRLHVAIPVELPVPASFESELRARMASVGVQGRTALEVLAVIDEPVARTTLVEIATRLDGAVSLDEAIGSGLVTEFEQREVQLRSARERGGIRRSLDAPRRRAVHAAIARSVSGSLRLDHLFAATETSDDDLAAELETEAHRCVGLGRYSDAARYFSKASGVSGATPDRERRLLAASAFAFYSDDAELASALSPSVSRCSPSLARDLTLGGIGYLLGDFLEALALVRIAIAAYPEEPLSLFGAAVIASLELAVVDLPGAIATSDIALDSISTPAAPSSPGEARLRLTRGFALWIAGIVDASDEALAPLVALPLNRPERADALTIYGQREFYGGDGERALSTINLAIDSARASSAKHILPLGVALRAHILYSLGQWDAALDDANAVLTHTSASHNGNHDVLAHSVIAMISAHSGELEFAERSVRIAQRLGVERPLPQHTAAAAIAAAVTEREGGHPHAVIHALAPMLEGSLGLGLTSTGFTGWRAMHAEALIALGSLDRASTVIEQFATEPGIPYFGYAGWLRGLLAEANGQADAAASAYRTALHLGAESSTPFAHALALRSLGTVLGSASSEGADAARDAARLFSRLGATAYLPTEPAPTGGLEALHGWRTLTPREHDTAVLAAEGMLNREIAAAMHVSVKTVEHHMANSLAKLGLRSRRDLERARV